ncbi:MAG: peptidase S16 [Micavibrio aeruginosavorus]|uniref:Peptidase S16 n=1 Tax=Micavibrio aeruginosavorus TaxID=349221 RepID=A0A2W5MWE0_9BACT|nr:MAG: peptidase S16 [Micavibrio aeruginosavorus]
MATPYKPRFEDLPPVLPIFPLGGVLLLPRGQLPLNIFEPRYLAMVEDAIKTHRLVGMVQTKDDGSVYSVGCAGRITSFNETPDGRNEIVLTGVSRFKIEEELGQKDGYRRIRANWDEFSSDIEPMACLDMDRGKLRKLLKNYFEQQGLTCSWDAVDKASDEKLITSLAMICPFDAKEKQALLEAQCCKERAKLFMTMLEMETTGGCSCSHKH